MNESKAHVEPRTHVVLYDAEGEDEEFELAAVAGMKPGDTQLLWVDLLAADAETLSLAWRVLALSDRIRIAIERGASNPALGNHGEVFWARTVALRKVRGSLPQGVVVALVCGPDFVLTIHDEPVDYLERLRTREDANSRVGVLSPETFVAALLDWHLATYFEAVADFERDIERLEVGILSVRKLDCLPELRQLRRGASRLRRMLAPHRVVYGGLSRPDFRPAEGKDADRHFHTLDIHFERAMDVVENARDLVIGSFELFSSQTALQTNKAMYVLAFATVVLGVLAVIAGTLGMNFDAPFFDTETPGFLVATGSMVLLGIAALIFGRWKRWF